MTSIGSGFSLLESLVVLALFGMLASSVSMFLGDATAGYARSRDRSEAASETDRLDAVLGDVVAHAIPPSIGADQPGQPHIDRHGNAAAFHFVALTPDVLGSGLAAFDLGFEGAIGDQALTLSWISEGASQSRKITLLEHLVQGKFEYRGVSGEWQESDPEAGSDTLRAIKISWAAGKDSLQQVRTIGLLLTKNPWCAFDSVTLDCRS